MAIGITRRLTTPRAGVLVVLTCVTGLTLSALAAPPGGADDDIFDDKFVPKEAPKPKPAARPPVERQPAP